MNIQEYENLNHSVWECKYHLVFIPKYRKKVLYGVLRRQISSILGKLTEGKGCKVLEVYVMLDHIYFYLSISPKMRVSDVVRTIKSISGRLLKWKFEYMRKSYWGVDGIWSNGYFVENY